MGKAVGGGFPLGIVASTKELMTRWSVGAHGTHLRAVIPWPAPRPRR